MTDILTIKNGRKVVNNGMNEEKYYWMKLTLQSEKGLHHCPWREWCWKKHTVQYDRWYASTQSRIDLF